MKKNTLCCFCLFFILAAKGFANTTYTLDIVVYGNPSSQTEFNSTGYSINQQVQEYSFCGLPGPAIVMAVIDSINCQPWNNCNNNFGQGNTFFDPDQDCMMDVNTIYNCRPRPENYFIFPAQDSAAIQGMANMISQVPAGNFIIAYSAFPVEYSQMDPAFVNAFQQLGSAMVPNLPDHVPFIFFCKKGDLNSVSETIGSNSSSMITLTVNYECTATRISEMLDENSLSVFSNPVQHEINIQLHRGNTSWVVSVYDALGRCVYEEEMRTRQKTISTINIQSGMYIVKVSGDGFDYQKKVCIVAE